MLPKSEKVFQKNGNETIKKSPLLPPCKVCGEKASGLHYGVNTCEACKAFFRRSLQRGKLYMCHEKGECMARSGKRNKCSACRFKKCTDLGMCREAIKTGRYTHEKKISDINEIKRIDKLKQNRDISYENSIEMEKNMIMDFEISTEVEQEKTSNESFQLLINNDFCDDMELQSFLELSQQSFQPFTNEQKKLKMPEGQFTLQPQQHSFQQLQLHQQQQQQQLYSYNNYNVETNDNSVKMDNDTDIEAIENPLNDIIIRSFLPSPSSSYLNIFPLSPPPSYFSHSSSSPNNLSSLSLLSSPLSYLPNSSPQSSSPSLYSSSSSSSFLTSSSEFFSSSALTTSPFSTSIASFQNFSPRKLFSQKSTSLSMENFFPNSNREEKLDEIIKSISDIHLKNSRFNEDFYKQLPRFQQEYLERKKLQIEVYGSLKPLSKDEYYMIYKSTGLDVDGRKEYMMNELPHLEKAVRRFISFAKTIPGFNSLSIEDQISLIKSSKFEAWMLFGHRLFNVEHMLYTGQSGRVVSGEDMKKVNNSQLVDDIFKLQEKIHQMKLSHDEMCIMAALCVMSCDTYVLENPELVDHYQNLLLECLLHLFNKKRPQERLRFAKFTNCLLYMKSMKMICMREEEGLVVQWGSLVEIPELIYEIWSS